MLFLRSTEKESKKRAATYLSKAYFIRLRNICGIDEFPLKWNGIKNRTEKEEDERKKVKSYIDTTSQFGIPGPSNKRFCVRIWNIEYLCIYIYIYKCIYFKSNDRESSGSICKSSHILNRHLLFWVLLLQYFVFTFHLLLLLHALSLCMITFCVMWVSERCLCLWKRLPYRFSSCGFFFCSEFFVCAFYLLPWSNEVLRYVDGWKRIRTKGNRHAHPAIGNDDYEEEERKLNTIFRYARILHVCHVSMFNRSTFVFYSISKCANTVDVALCVPKNTKINRVSLSLSPSLVLPSFLSFVLPLLICTSFFFLCSYSYFFSIHTTKLKIYTRARYLLPCEYPER